MRDEPRDKLSFAGFEAFLDAAAAESAGVPAMVLAALVGYYDMTPAGVREMNADKALEMFGRVSERLNGDLDRLQGLEKKVAAPSASSPTEVSRQTDGGNDTAS